MPDYYPRRFIEWFTVACLIAAALALLADWLGLLDHLPRPPKP